jgi:hypothetical protein
MVIRSMMVWTSYRNLIWLTEWPPRFLRDVAVRWLKNQHSLPNSLTCANKNNIKLVQPEVGISFNDTDFDHNLEPITTAHNNLC